MSNTSSVSIVKLMVQFAAPLSAVILMIFGTAFYTTFLSVYLSMEGYSKNDIGLIQSAYFLGMLIGGFQMERVIKNIGHIQVLAVFGSVATCSTLLQSLCHSLLLWMFLRFLVGLSIAALYIVIESWMLDHSTKSTRGVVLALYMICLYTSQSVSQQFLSFLDMHSLMPFILSAIFTSLSVIPVGLTTNKIQLPPVHESITLRKIFVISPFGMIGCIVAGLCLSAIYSFFPLLALSKGIRSENLMSITIAGGVLLQYPIGKLSDYFDRRKTLLGVVLATLGLSILGWLGQGFSREVLFVLAFLLGGLLFTFYPLCITKVCDHLDHSQITKTTALLCILYGLGSVFGPLISSSFIEMFGINMIFIYLSLLLAIFGAIGFYTTLLRPVVPLEDQAEFVSLPNLTPIANEMDPRGA